MGMPPYDPRPCYPPVSGRIDVGWSGAVEALPDSPTVLALDGPAVLHWALAVECLTAALVTRGRRTDWLPMLKCFQPWEEIVRLTASPTLEDDPDFAPLTRALLADLLLVPDAPRDPSADYIVYGPGAALVEHDVLWYLDLPKRFAEDAVATQGARNLGQPDEVGPGTTRRLFYIDWPILDHHRDAIFPQVDRWIDAQELTVPRSVSGAVLRSTLADLVTHPLRTQPTFNTSPWGGHWGQQKLGHNVSAPNTALGYELIAPESGVLIGGAATGIVEVPFSLIVTSHPTPLLGRYVYDTFGASFPIRFDYLDTFGGGNLSIHCHPQAAYMQEVFGWNYTQHETYYIVLATDDSKVFIGLVNQVDVKSFYRDAQRADKKGIPFDIGRYVQSFPATPGQLFMVPAGTPHGSGEGNVVLEISATPYLYSLRFYDWLRQDESGRQRPVHVAHAFNNLDQRRAGARVRQELVQRPRRVREGAGWHEELLGRLPDCFFEVHRLVMEGGASAYYDTNDRFHVLNVVDGVGIEIETAGGYRHRLNHAETLVVPAACDHYEIRNLGDDTTWVIKSFVQ
jgi:mannose-6-phosphate isomerase class I